MQHLFKNLIKRLYRQYAEFTIKSRVLGRLIHLQHQILPMPIGLFDRLFQIKSVRSLFNFYAHHVFMSAYDSRTNTTEYWLSKAPMYWFFYSRYQIDFEKIDRMLKMPEVSAFLQDSSLTAVELGFGIGRNYRYLREQIDLRKYVAVEINSFACDYARNQYPDPNLQVINQSIEAFVAESFPFEVLLVFGRVLMYLPPPVLDQLIASLPGRGVKKILIFAEGSQGEDRYFPDGTIMYNFKHRLEAAGYLGNFIEQADAEGILEVFVLY